MKARAARPTGGALAAMESRSSRQRHPNKPHFGLARMLSKLGFCSRAQAIELICAGRVRLNGAVCRRPEAPCDPSHVRIEVDAEPVRAAPKVYLMLNKPRGLVTTRADESGRPTVYQCLAEHGWLSSVGRLDRASEGLLLFTNDTRWADRIIAPESHLDKCYHVQIDQVADDSLLRSLREGATTGTGERLGFKRVSLLRQGTSRSWLEIILDEGRNRQIRRVLEAHQLAVLRLIRVAIGRLQLGGLAKGKTRLLSAAEVKALDSA